jgi:deferrochelatase/peroxidase EfeB
MFGPAAAGGPVLPGAALRFADTVTDNGADADVVVQLTADTQAALTRAVVATQRQVTGDGRATLSGVWFGYRRDDRRSWLGFHDGVDNVNGPERINVVEVGPQADDRWLRGGTYLAFLRIEIDLDVWEALSRQEQELAVGRDKHTGGALNPAGDEVRRVALAAGTTSVFARANLPTREPGLVDLDDPTGLGGSHVQRTRRHPNLRIFRQGYEYLEVTGNPPVLQTGLNFVSFQSSPGRVIGMLRSPSWLGTDSFAGSSQAGFPQVPDLLRVHAAGMFAVPPASDDGLPGREMLRDLKRLG